MKKTVIITGTNSGIGKALAYYCVREGYHVISICRKSDKSSQFFENLLNEMYTYKPEIIYGDLSSKKDIKNIVKEIENSVNNIDLLINNAGVLKLKQEYSKEGLEMTMAVNLIAVYRLTELLLKTYQKFDIINITSELFKKGIITTEQLNECSVYDGSQRYNDSKKAQLYYTYNLSERLKNKSNVIAMHPGIVASDAFRDYPKIVMKFFNKRGV